MKKFWMVVIFLFVGLSSAFADVQVSFDSQGKLMELTPIETVAMGLFTDVQNLEKILVYRKDDGSYILDIFSQQGNNTLRDTRVLSEKEFQSLRESVDVVTASYHEMDQKGRLNFLVGTFFAGAYYGFLMNGILNTSDFGPISPLVFSATWASSFTLPFFFTIDGEMSLGEAALADIGIGGGFYDGYQIYLALSGDDYYTHNDVANFLSQFVTSIGEGVGGYYWARANHYTEGNSFMIALGKVYGLWLSGWINNMWGNSINVTKSEIQIKSGVNLLGYTLGVVGGALLNEQQNYTLGDDTTFFVPIVLGNMMAWSIKTWILGEYNYDSRSTPYFIVGSLLGGVGGYFLTTGRDISKANGGFLALTTAAGSLIGRGVGAFIFPIDSETLTANSLFVGAALGFGIGYTAFVLNGDQSEAKKESAWNFRFNPSSLLVYALPSDSVGEVPFAQLEYAF